MTKYWAYSRLAFIESTAYRVSMMLSLLIGPFNLMVQYFIWSALFSLQEGIAGYNLVSVMTYFTVAMIISYLIYNGLADEFKDLIVRGTLTRELLRPIELMKQLFFYTLGHRTMALLIEALPLIVIAALLLGAKSIVPAMPIYFFLGILASFLINYLSGYALSLSAFWTKKTNAVKFVSFAIFLVATGYGFPLDILPEALQVISAYLFFQHIVYAPTKYFIGDFALGPVTSEVTNLLLAGAWIIVLYLLCIRIEKQAMKNYQGVGQ
ncbi:MAG: ABC transporter permease [Candidatus Woesearchaeota archaeon]